MVGRSPFVGGAACVSCRRIGTSAIGVGVPNSSSSSFTNTSSKSKSSSTRIAGLNSSCGAHQKELHMIISGMVRLQPGVMTPQRSLFSNRGFSTAAGDDRSGETSSKNMTASSEKEITPPATKKTKKAFTWKSMKYYGKKAFKMSKRIAVKIGGVLTKWTRSLFKLLVAFVKEPAVVKEWYKDIKDAALHFLKWVKTGFVLFWKNIQVSKKLTLKKARGHPLSLRERKLLVRTTGDCLKLIPFSFFLIVPFAELALPIALRLFPNMMPSTFFEQSYDQATLARKFKAKQELAEFFSRSGYIFFDQYY